ncbi:MAG: hypothetical protein ACPG9C_00040 [Acidimicrobiales bacterium]
MRSLIPGEPWVVLGRIIFKIQADRLPRYVQFSLCLDSINDPTGRYPTPRSYRIDPKINAHRVAPMA